MVADENKKKEIIDMKKIKAFIKSAKGRMIVATAVITGLMATTALCEETTLELNFSASEMFSWTQMILDVMMPILYITLGVSLAFIVIRALKQAFSS